MSGSTAPVATMGMACRCVVRGSHATDGATFDALMRRLAGSGRHEARPFPAGVKPVARLHRTGSA
jgi:hypothetical protein